MYDGIRKAVGPKKILTSPLQSATREILHDRDEKSGRWVHYFSLRYSKQNTVTDASLKHMENLSTMNELDTEPNY